MAKDEYTIVKERGAVKGAALRAHLDTLPDGSYFVTVKPAKNGKTQSQNSYLHVLFTIAAKELNREGFGHGQQWTKDRVKAYAKQAGLYPMFDAMLPGGEIIQMCKDTHELDKDEAMETIDRVLVHFADELKIYLPEPNEQIRIAV